MAEIRSIYASGNTAHDLLDQARELIPINGQILILYWDEESNMKYSRFGLSDLECLWLIENYKHSVLL